jgi:hypothetical protein
MSEYYNATTESKAIENAESLDEFSEHIAIRPERNLDRNGHRNLDSQCHSIRRLTRPLLHRDLPKGLPILNKIIRTALLCALAFTATTAPIAQRRAANKSPRKATAPQILCEGDSIPKGYVIVGYKSSAKCGAKSQLVIKKPDEAEIVSSGSPIPDGFHVANQLSSTDCVSRKTNPKSNALSIVSNGVIGSERTAATTVDDTAISRAFASRTSDVQVQGEGTVIRLLPDDLDGSRHQRFIVQLASGQTVLVSHNIDIAPRVDPLAVGDSVRFNGEYVWNEKGGVIHWTHHDPQSRHVAGWIAHNGRTFK